MIVILGTQSRSYLCPGWAAWAGGMRNVLPSLRAWAWHSVTSDRTLRYTSSHWLWHPGLWKVMGYFKINSGALLDKKIIAKILREKFIDFGLRKYRCASSLYHARAKIDNLHSTCSERYKHRLTDFRQISFDVMSRPNIHILGLSHHHRRTCCIFSKSRQGLWIWWTRLVRDFFLNTS